MSASRSFGFSLATCLAAAVASSVQAGDEALPEPRQLTIAQSIDRSSAAAMLLPARRYYAFWNTGDERYASEALSPDFVDMNLPVGRPQGPDGPIFASRAFRRAVPDLTVVAEEAWVVGDQIISRLHFTGHFTGQFDDRSGDGHPVSFDAIDIYTIRGGLIAANWHLEDNLTLLRQLGVIRP